MIFTLTKASDWGIHEQVEISSLEELEALQKKYEQPRDPTNTARWGRERPVLVVNFFTKEITIYDYYLE